MFNLICALRFAVNVSVNKSGKFEIIFTPMLASLLSNEVIINFLKTPKKNKTMESNRASASQDSGYESILFNSTNSLNANRDESTPVKEEQDNQLFDSCCLTPIKSTNDKHHEVLNGSIDIDLIYLSQLSNKINYRIKFENSFSENLNESSIKLFRSSLSPSTFYKSKKSFSVTGIRRAYHDKDSLKVDILSELYNRSILHVIKSICLFLSNKEYMKASMVSKTWMEIIHQDLKCDRQRLKALKRDRKSFKATKVN